MNVAKLRRYSTVHDDDFEAMSDLVNLDVPRHFERTMLQRATAACMYVARRLPLPPLV